MLICMINQEAQAMAVALDALAPYVRNMIVGLAEEELSMLPLKERSGS
jgi:hypothetical protein